MIPSSPVRAQYCQKDLQILTDAVLNTLRSRTWPEGLQSVALPSRTVPTRHLLILAAIAAVTILVAGAIWLLTLLV